MSYFRHSIYTVEENSPRSPLPGAINKRQSSVYFWQHFETIDLTYVMEKVTGENHFGPSHLGNHLIGPIQLRANLKLWSTAQRPPVMPNWIDSVMTYSLRTTRNAAASKTINDADNSPCSMLIQHVINHLAVIGWWRAVTRDDARHINCTDASYA